jgi:hypothetical protein
MVHAATEHETTATTIVAADPSHQAVGTSAAT